MSGTLTKEDADTPDSKHDADINNDKKNAGQQQRQQQQQHPQQSHSNFGQRQRSLATSKSVFVTGLAHAINKTHVERLFSKFGRPERISEFMTSQKSNSRFCFVELDSIENAQKAMDNLNGRTLLHKRLVVLPSSNNDNSSSGAKTTAVPMSPAKERILIDKKIAAIKKKIKESQSDWSDGGAGEWNEFGEMRSTSVFRWGFLVQSTPVQ